MTTPRDNNRGRIPELDGLRGTAIFVVIIWHYFYFFPAPGHHTEGTLRSLYVLFERCIALGWSGVDLFFVLSGFLIGGILLDAKGSPSYFKTFYARRFFRILPIYYLWTLCYIVWRALSGPVLLRGAAGPEAPESWTQIFAHFFFVQNLGFIFYSGVAAAWFVSTWSLAVEEQFYLVAPLLVRQFAGRRFAVFLSAVVLVAPGFRLYIRSHYHTATNLDPAYILMPGRADALALGMLAALLWREPAFREWLSGQAGLVYSSFGLLLAGMAVLTRYSPDQHSLTMESIGYTWIAFFYVVTLLLALSQSTGPVAFFARMSWLRELGGVSYCMYLIHQVVNLLSRTLLLPSAQGETTWNSLAAPALALAITYGLAKISWKYFEKPLIDRGHTFRYAKGENKNAAPKLQLTVTSKVGS
jgi:peptidoglycan/LPS O-acetylase OafA/YrhL